MKRTNNKTTNFKNWKIAFISYVLVLTSIQTHALSLNEYLDQVREKNLSYQSSTEQTESATQQARESELVFSPQIFANARIGHDKKLSSPPMIVFEDTKSENYQFGVSQQFNFGLQTKLYYELGQMDFVGTKFSNGAPNAYWDASPKVELTLPLLGNGFGRTARANEQIIKQQNMTQKHSSLAQSHSLLVQAEAAYWRLAASQESVKIQEQALKAAQNILSYVSKKKNMNLGENSDVLQAKALVENSELQLLQAQNEEKAARRGFNQQLNKDLLSTVPNLDGFNYDNIQKIEIPKARPGDRADVKAAEAQALLSEASSQIVKERNRATLDLYGNYALNGRSEEMNDALKNVDQSNRDTAFIGMRFNMPLNFSATDSAREGASKAVKAAELNHRYKLYQQEQDWIDLSEKFAESKSTLRLATNMELAQKAKLENERERLRQGRTTTYQVLLFEQDYSQAQAAKVRAASLVLSLQSQTQLYKIAFEGGK